ncbi:hypothetical protein TVAG_074400 [Trichomonas vaginalis G3]|uniref:Saposin B-type domain-containing protein n=1 Tax=Trichomonas vaginalis (strain ATCC PRA-98 / G3) TaxID=412133 RepID=A2E3V7_TRIV3|nr:saposin family [Trichomonas vaginalis G3]EAY12612.1 hypothetical protein TVAG_074400 [Trichomonas vaginalis G3]KAI5546975.1 saposin family [Trichomonas vaginalis G3]|eukprot:XP_001324835.1 hypothetical protein [Trichomonas vaginalis G3]
MSGPLCSLCKRYGEPALRYARSGASIQQVYNVAASKCNNLGYLSGKCREIVNRNINRLYYQAKVYPWCDANCFCSQEGYC